jgi:hypothetical protein
LFWIQKGLHLSEEQIQIQEIKMIEFCRYKLIEFENYLRSLGAKKSFKSEFEALTISYFF